MWRWSACAPLLCSAQLETPILHSHGPVVPTTRTHHSPPHTHAPLALPCNDMHPLTPTPNSLTQVELIFEAASTQYADLDDRILGVKATVQER